MNYQIASSDPELLERARTTADRFAGLYRTDAVAGIVLLGAVVRGYFDEASDIDLAIIAKDRDGIVSPPLFQHVDGFEVHCHVSDYGTELGSDWDMSKRRTYSEGVVIHDPGNLTRELLSRKVPLQPGERIRLLMSGLVLSEWYCNRLADLWVKRGDMVSAHAMFAPGIDRFFEMLFSLNHELVPDVKWRTYLAARLGSLPPLFEERFPELLSARELSVTELERRRNVFLALWTPMVSTVETEVGLSYADMLNRV